MSNFGEIVDQSFVKEEETLTLLISDIEKDEIFKNQRNVWKILGEQEPYWSVLVDEYYKRENLDKNISRFEQSGLHNVKKIIGAFSRSGIKIETLKKMQVLELGCGVGRVTVFLSKIFRTVYAVDISNYHLDILKERLIIENLDNIIAIEMNKLNSDISDVSSYNFFYSELTLQHNSPPIQNLLLDQHLKNLQPEGLFYFQTVTHIPGYSFWIKDYLKSRRTEMEIHMMNMKQIFAILESNSCKLYGVYRDSSTGVDLESYVFFGQKNKNYDKTN